MANEQRKRYNFLSGRITDNPLTDSATTINSAELAGLPAVTSSEHAVLVLDPTGVGNGPEVVYVTAHTGSATSATIVRGREGTSRVQHASTIYWVHVATRADFELIGESSGEPSGSGLPYEGQRYIDATNDRLEVYTGSAWQRIGHYSQSGRTGGFWSRSTNLSIASGGDGTQITFTTEGADSDGFLAPPSGTVTIPSGFGGIYAWECVFSWASAPTAPGLLIDVNGGRRQAMGLAYTASSYNSGTSGIINLSAADTLSFKALHQTGSDININPAYLWLCRLAI